jgi:hypothetical protein
MTSKETLRQVFYLSEAPSPPVTPHTPLTHCIRVYRMLHTGMGRVELTREKVRGAIVHKAGRK